MDTKVREISGMADEFSKFAHEMADYLHERAAEFEKYMTKFMDESGKEFGMFGEGTKLGDYIEKNPRRAAFFALMTGMMFTHMKKTGRFSSFFETETKSGETSKPKMTAKKKAA